MDVVTPSCSALRRLFASGETKPSASLCCGVAFLCCACCVLNVGPWLGAVGCHDTVTDAGEGTGRATIGNIVVTVDS